MSNWKKQEKSPNAISWQNTKHSVHITLYLKNIMGIERGPRWEVGLGQGSGFSHYLALDHKDFNSKAKAMQCVDKIKSKYNNGWF